MRISYKLTTKKLVTEVTGLDASPWIIILIIAHLIYRVIYLSSPELYNEWDNFDWQNSTENEA